MPEQQWVLGRIAQRFRWRILHRDSDGFVVLELEPDQPAATLQTATRSRQAPRSSRCEARSRSARSPSARGHRPRGFAGAAGRRGPGAAAAAPRVAGGRDPAASRRSSFALSESKISMYRFEPKIPASSTPANALPHSALSSAASSSTWWYGSMISSGLPNVRRFGVTKTATPPGRTTRAASATARSGSGTCSIECTAMAASKLDVANGNRRMSAQTVSLPWATSTPASASTPTVCRGSRSLKLWPTPQPRSTTEPSGRKGAVCA